MAAVQVFGAESVLQAAENLKCPAWAMFWGGNNLYTKYEGDNMEESLAYLATMLETLSQGGTTAIYKIKFFQPENGKQVIIKERTECNAGSFNFKLIEQEEREMGLIRNSSQYGVIAGMQKKIEDLEKKLVEAEEVDDEPDSIGTVLIDLIKNPDQLAQIVNIGRSLMGLPVQNMEAIGSTRAIPETVVVSKENELERLGAAIDVLEKSDPQLVSHLEKLAKMATDNPDQFKATVSMLDLKM